MSSQQNQNSAKPVQYIAYMAVLDKKLAQTVQQIAEAIKQDFPRVVIVDVASPPPHTIYLRIPAEDGYNAVYAIQDKYNCDLFDDDL